MNEELDRLITGGARGITAAVALELAKRYQPNLIIVGRSALPDAAEAPETASLTTPRKSNPPLSPACSAKAARWCWRPSKRHFIALMQDREIRSNLARIAASWRPRPLLSSGCPRPPAMTRLLEEVETRFGGIEGVIHGAGIMEDKLVKDKTPEFVRSGLRHQGSKRRAAERTAETGAAEVLRFLCFHYQPLRQQRPVGLRCGQRDAEQVRRCSWIVAGLAACLAVAWGPWSSIGMIADLERHLTQRGLKLISPGSRVPAFWWKSCVFGRKGETEVIIAGGNGRGCQGTQANFESRSTARSWTPDRASGVMA